MQEVENVENFEVEIFTTKELVINELGSVKGKKLIVLEDKQVAIKNLEALRAKHEARSEELIALEKLSPAELKELRAINSALKSPRVLIDKYKKEGVSVIAHCSSQFKSVWDSLILINKPLEDKVADKIKKEDQRKLDEKAELERLEQEKEDKIRKSIDDFEANSMLIVQKMTINSKENDLVSLNNLSTAMVDVEPFDILLEKAQDRVTEAYRLKVEDLDIAEAQRLKNEKLEADNKKAKDLADLQAKRLKELAPLMAFVREVDITNLSGLAQIEYDTILGEASSLFESDVKQKKREQEKKDADAKAEKDALFELRKQRFINLGFVDSVDSMTFKGITVNHSDLYNSSPVIFEQGFLEFSRKVSDIVANEQSLIDEENAKKEKDAVFEIRKSRLSKLGFNFTKFKTVVNTEHTIYNLNTDDIYSCSSVDFEKIFTDAGLAIQKAIDDEKKAKEQEAEDLRLSLEDANRLKLENEARVKRLAKDKASLSFRIKASIEVLSAGCENEEISLFIQEANAKIENLRNELLTQLENL